MRCAIRSQHGPDLLTVSVIATQAVELFAGAGRMQLADPAGVRGLAADVVAAAIRGAAMP
jgi:hypothetical protein